MQGIINIFKNSGMTSFDVVRNLRKILHIKKIGHTGTLDPMAQGVLVVCVGKATKLVQDIETYTKTYVASFDFGYKTDTYDTEGQIIDKSNLRPSEEEFLEVIKKYIGSTKQIPPMYSALKVNGEKLYNLARKGIKVERKSRDINIDFIEILEFSKNHAKIRCKVSKGTYIRSLIYDIGEDLGCFATMTSLLREEVGDINMKSSYTLDEIESLANNDDFKFLTKVQDFFNYPKINLENTKEITLFKNGNTVKLENNFNDGMYKVYKNDEFLGLAEIHDKIYLKGYKFF